MSDIEHKPFTSADEALAFGENENGCRYCSLDRRSWSSNPSCWQADPAIRGIRGYESRQKKYDWEGGGERVLQPWMAGPDESRYGRALRRLNVTDLAALIDCLDQDQRAAFVGLLNSRSSWLVREVATAADPKPRSEP